MRSGTTWIERDSDGRPYYVRRKSRDRGAPRTSSHAISFWKKSSHPFLRPYRQEHLIFPAPVSDPLPSASPTEVFSKQPDFQPAALRSWALPFYALNMYQYPYNQNPAQSTFPQLLQDQSNQRQTNQKRTLKPDMQYYSAPHPQMYPIPPPQPQAYPAMHPPHLSNTFPHTTNYPTATLSPGTRFISPPRYPKPDDLRYKCSSCGRFRSPAYHYKHPIPTGELPKATVCRRCREDETSSDASSEARLERRLRRARSRNRSLSRDEVMAPVVRRRSERSSSRVRFRGRDSSRDSAWHDRRYARIISRSSSLEVGPLRVSVEDRRSHRHRPSKVEHVERIHFIEDPPVRRPEILERTIYVEENARGRQRRRMSVEDYYTGDQEYQYPRRSAELTQVLSTVADLLQDTYHFPSLKAAYRPRSLGSCHVRPRPSRPPRVF